jgi:hypothetical protein
MIREARQINVSVVTREPASSRTVRHLVNASLKFERHRALQLRKLERWTDKEIQRSTIVSPSLQNELGTVSPSLPVITPTIGLHSLLPRVGPLVGLSGNCSVLESSETQLAAIAGFHLFGYPASIQLPSRIDQHHQTIVVGLIHRPGGESIQLTGRIVDNEDALARALEDIIRDHVEQWTPSRALWSGSIETLDPAWLQTTEGHRS